MKKVIKIKKSERGFTLLEVIITIVIAAILGSFLITFMGTAVTRSSDPIFQVQNIASAESIMEKITADYLSYLNGGTGSATWADLETGYAVTTSPMTNSAISISGSAMTIPTFQVKQITVTVGNQTFVSYFIQ